MLAPDFRTATSADLDSVLALMRAFYAFDQPAFNETAARAALEKLLENSNFGRVWLIQAGTQIAGYLVLCFGYSLEYCGRDAFIDEIYIQKEFRGRGFGKLALEYAERVCRELGIKALHLEVGRENVNAQGLYRKHGFADHGRYLMSKRIACES